MNQCIFCLRSVQLSQEKVTLSKSKGHIKNKPNYFSFACHSKKDEIEIGIMILSRESGTEY